MSFTKPAGLRLTDIDLESRSQVFLAETWANVFIDIEPLFPNQKLNIENCCIEIEIYPDYSEKENKKIESMRELIGAPRNFFQ